MRKQTPVMFRIGVATLALAGLDEIERGFG